MTVYIEKARKWRHMTGFFINFKEVLMENPTRKL